MTSIISTNITSPLGLTSIDNFNSVLSGHTALDRYTDKWNIKEEFVAALFSEKQRNQIEIKGYSFFESLIIFSIKDALSRCQKIELDKTLLVISSTKGNISLLENESTDFEQLYLGNSAEKIASYFGIPTEPIVVCNACISGVAAEIIATRILEYTDRFEYAIVAGADSLCKFFITGFQSLKALSLENCRPFDSNRNGLNLGEASATLILSKNDNGTFHPWYISSGAIRNDANHISGPSRTGEGSFRALKRVMNQVRESSVISVHGTSTIYNDEMESIAIERAGLESNPILALKGYFGHTMGAAGILETIITMMAVDSGILPGVKGYENKGVSGKINISNEKRNVYCDSFIKLLSGFGGCNAAVKIVKKPNTKTEYGKEREKVRYRVLHQVSVTEKEISMDGTSLDICNIDDVYHHLKCNYPKYYKMDMMNRIAFIASELLLSKDDKSEDVERAIILFNRSSSVISDCRHASTMNEFSSPSVFVYTLPNIMTGEIAIRNQTHSETSLYITNSKDSQIIDLILESTLAADEEIKEIITGWIDVPSKNNYIANFMTIDRQV